MEPSARLLDTRRAIAQVSLQRAEERLQRQRVEEERETGNLTLEVLGSQVVDDRVPSACCFNPLGTEVATAGWSGKVCTWTLPTATLGTMYEGHTDRVNSVSYSNTGRLISASADNTVIVWGNVRQVLQGHSDRVNDAAFHVIEEIAISVSHDTTMKVWDVPTGETVLTQHGHAKPVYALAVHPDGSLAVTGDLGGVGLVWDLRTGKAILHLHGHLKQFLALSLAPNGYTVASGSDDNTVRLWDLRRHGLVATIPAHEKLVSAVHCTGTRVFSASYDGCVKVWKLPEGQLEATVPHGNKVTSVCVSTQETVAASCCFDKTMKIMKMGRED